MSAQKNLGGTFLMKGTGKTIHRIGYGAMQLPGPGVWGEPKDPKGAIAVVKEAIALGINHIDTSDFYGPHVSNRIIKEAIHPYPTDLLIVTKVGAKRAPDKSWPSALGKEDLTAAVHDNLRNLGIDAMDVVNLRVGGMAGPNENSILEPLAVLIDLKKQGLIRHIGLSNISQKQFNECVAMTDIVCVQNHYNLAHRHDDAFIDDLNSKGVAYVPFFPLGGFRPIQSAKLDEIALKMKVGAKQLALAWLLQRSPNILLIAGTSSVAHLRENVEVADIKIAPEIVSELNKIGAPG